MDVVHPHVTTNEVIQVTHRYHRGIVPTLIVLLVASAVLAACHSPAPAANGEPAITRSGSVADSPGSASVAASSTDQQPAAGIVPDVVGRRLSEAEGILSDAGFMSVRAVDDSGAGRAILEKNNWVVKRQDPAGGGRPATGISITLSVVKPTDGLPSISVDKGIVPNVVCHDLQDAQDALRKAGYYVLIAKDGLAQHRYPLVDRDWIVVGQSAEPGSSPKRTSVIQVTVVKYGEPTGNSGCRS